jgi:putative iron-regulated protein
MIKSWLVRMFTLTALGTPGVYACAVFSPPQSYSDPLFLLDFDAGPQALGLLTHASDEIDQSIASAKKMQQAIRVFLAGPTASGLEGARRQWRKAREDYQRLEWMRFAGGPMDWPEAREGDGFRPEGPEARMNAWPVNEAFIDYVKGANKSGIVQDTTFELTRSNLISQNQALDENNVSTGWHAIEFLLWGQDHSSSGPGDRPVEDFSAESPIARRRGQYLEIITALLVDDLKYLQQEFDTNDPLSYFNRMKALPPREVLGSALHGATSLLMLEMHGERFSVPLDSGMQEDEHSCFSDNTLADLRANFYGIKRMLTLGNSTERSDSVLALMHWKDPQLAGQLVAALDLAEQAIVALPEPFDQLILSDPKSATRAKAESALSAMLELGKKLKATSNALGIQIVVPGV